MTDSGDDGAQAVSRGTQLRTIMGRRSLPNGRALVGALLVTVAAVGAFVVARGDGAEPGVDYFVAARDVAAGETFDAADLAIEPMTLSPQLADVAFAAEGDDAAALRRGATALRALHAGALLLAPDVRMTARVEGADAVGVAELTFPVPLSRTPAVLARGDRVTVLASDANVDDTRVAFEDALVLGFERLGDAIGSGSQGNLTLGLSDPAEVLRGVHMSFLDLTVVLTTHAREQVFPDRHAGSTAETDDADSINSPSIIIGESP